ncbi:MAG: V-type ATP synthase subunit I [Firmicutes bacterium]|nr:V-type ATP synthase subunit I [Bacillota bacterium]
MKKINLIGLKSELNAILEALRVSSSFEMGKLEKLTGSEFITDQQRRDHIQASLTRTKFAIEFSDKSHTGYLNTLINNKSFLKYLAKRRPELYKFALEQTNSHKYKKPKSPMFFYRNEIDYAEFKSISKYEEKILSHIHELEQINQLIPELKNEMNNNNLIRRELKPYAKLTVPLDQFTNNNKSVRIVGTIQERSFNAFMAECDTTNLVIEKVTKGNMCCVALFCHKDNEVFLNEIYKYGLNKCSYSFPVTAQQKIDELEATNVGIRYKILDLLKYAATNADMEQKLKVYHDWLNLELEGVNIGDRILSTNRTFVLTGWVPEHQQQNVTALINQVSTDVFVQFTDPAPDEKVPTYTKNSAIVRPYESITNMYSYPSSRERDPNIFVGIFFFLFFGIMVGDVGYGIILFIATLAVLMFCKMERGTKSLIAIICMGGVSAIIWGLVFGGWLGLQTVGAGGKAVSIIPGLLDPVNDAILFLGLSLALGMIHIMFGITLKMVALLKQKRWLDAILDAGIRLTMLLGIVMFVSNLITPTGIVADIGLYMAIASVVLIMFTNGRKNKGFFGKITGGIAGVYSLVNYAGDILSYARLFAIGLVGAVIATVANRMGVMVFDIPGVGIPLGILVAVVFHSFNVGLAVLGAYVHNARLQFVEFFGKFYTGEGTPFAPMGTNTKYVILKNKKIIKENK